MATGLPDFWRSMDIAKQSLGVIINRPKYGGAIQLNGSVIVSAAGETGLISIVGQGMVYGGSVWLEYNSSQSNSEITMSLDGGPILMPSFSLMRKYSIMNPRSSIATINTFNSVDFIYSVGFSYGLTFESEFALGYSELHGTTPTVYYNLIYTLI